MNCSPSEAATPRAAGYKAPAGPWGVLDPPIGHLPSPEKHGCFRPAL